MRRLAAVALLAALLWPATAQAWTPHVARAAKWANARQGSVTFAVRTEQRLWGRRLDRQVPSASVFKAMLLVTYLRRSSVRHRALTEDDRALLRPMIRRSDNVAATRVRDIVGRKAVVRLARAAHMRHFHYDSVWGLSRTCAKDQARFMYRFDHYVPRRHRHYARHLLARIVPSQRWGIGKVALHGWRLHFKGGWGIGSGAVDHQVAFLDKRGYRIAVAILTTGNPSHSYGKATLKGVARRLLWNLPRL